ncbi:meiotic sister chromatid recombination protein, putative [Candida dubliniensis CD36]|uniref:Meiotic sister chromatid recombination protein, putative n=1 Tax=Candida dubliniensis (strain CD36 / ATCC MYA-646 / CBS 7987 / NCPF 3949 / NRRL Y-17841) TaxID=573826 RepID=B9WMT0_CANDC|nr:meiotic sister chromatid recombination protein, putative [Candida dubliniensis CD36]CAX40396.1 meiotic sister chromatid recombination protein, putative [Candida dubliniensis CD36]
MYFPIIVWLYVSITFVIANYGFDQWTNDDLKQFLKERKVAFNEALENPKLISLANEEAKKLEKGYKKVTDELNNNLNPPDNLLNDYLNFDYLFGKRKENYSIKEWIFESWPVHSLQSFLTQNNIQYHAKDTKDDLINKIKESFDSISAKNHGSSFYPGNWLYESWSENDLKDWLKSYRIDFNPSSTKDQLVEKLKEFSYQATHSIRDSKESLFDSLDLFDKTIFDKKGQIEDEFFETWSYSQLREWLYLHGFIDTKPGIYVEDLDKEKLVKIAQTYKKYLLSDIHTWLANTEKKYQPWLTKGEQKTKKKGGNLINDTFFVGINNWSKDKLREFLDVRKVPYSIFTTKHQLIQLVQKHKFDPIHVDTYAWIVNDVSTDSIKQWLVEQGENVEGTRKDIVSAFQNQFETLRKGFKDAFNNIDSQIRLFTPDINSYKRYLQKKLSEAEYKKLTEDKISKGFEVVQEYYKSAGDAAKEEFDKTAYSAEEALDQIEEASYEYSLEFLHKLEKGEHDVASFIKDAQIASKSYALSLIAKLRENTQKLQTNALNKLGSWWYGAKSGFDNKIDEAHQVVLNVHDQVSNYQEQVGNQYSSIKSEADEKYNSIAKEATQQYDTAVKNAQDHFKQAEEHVSQTHKKLEKDYVTYKSKIFSILTNAYRGILYRLSIFNSNAYDAAKSTGDIINNHWDSIVRTYSNADLKAYLRSFGYSYDWLSDLNRRELLSLATFQNKLFTGYNNLQNWEKSVGDVLNEAGDELKIKLGLKKEPKSLIAKLKSLVGF